jgi:hypothetical protein
MNHPHPRRRKGLTPRISGAATYHSNYDNRLASRPPLHAFVGRPSGLRIPPIHKPTLVGEQDGSIPQKMSRNEDRVRFLSLAEQ